MWWLYAVIRCHSCFAAHVKNRRPFIAHTYWMLVIFGPPVERNWKMYEESKCLLRSGNNGIHGSIGVQPYLILYLIELKFRKCFTLLSDICQLMFNLKLCPRYNGKILSKFISNMVWLPWQLHQYVAYTVTPISLSLKSTNIYIYMSTI